MSTGIQPPAIWRRFAAIVYDILLITSVSMGYAGICIGLGVAIFGNKEVLTSSLFFQLGWMAVIFGFFCFFWKKAGQTLGMRAWRLRIAQQSSLDLPTLFPCLLRCLFAPIGLTLFFTAFFRSDRQCLHDLISGTRVILLKKEK